MLKRQSKIDFTCHCIHWGAIGNLGLLLTTRPQERENDMDLGFSKHQENVFRLVVIIEANRDVDDDVDEEQVAPGCHC